MRLTAQQLEQMPERVQRSIREQIAGACVKREHERRTRSMTEAERQYGAVLELAKRQGAILHYAYEPWTFILAPDCRYTPDWMSIGVDGITLYEVKAYWRNKQCVGWVGDAKVKVRMAAGHYPWFRFVAVWWHDGEWKREEF